MTYGEIDEYNRLRNLWAWVMAQAIDDVVGYTKAMRRISSKRTIAESAITWMWRNDIDGPGSFIWCCLQLELDPARVRSKVIEKLRAKRRDQTLERIELMYG